MLLLEKIIKIGFWVGLSISPSWASTITNVSFTSNGGAFINDTIAEGTTSPLAFTSTTDLAQPFLNAADSTVSLGYGTYYAIAFLGFGSHQGAGTVAFLLNGVSTVSQAVTFPNPTAASANFATFALPGGDSLTISATGLSADRIKIAIDGNGLTADGNPDAFYLFSFVQGSSAIPEPAAAMLCGLGAVILGMWRLKR